MGANQVVTALEADGVTQTDLDILGLGRQVDTASKSVALATDDHNALLNALTSLQLIDDPVATIGSPSATKGFQLAGHDGTNATRIKTDAVGELQVDVLTMPAITGSVTISSMPALGAGTANIGDVDVLTVPADPFGTNADAASASGSISAKLRQIATTGHPVTGSLPAGTNNIGDVDVLTVPADPFGTNADVASASGSISAKLRQIATTGIPISAALPAGSANIGKVDVNLLGTQSPAYGSGTVGTSVLRVALATDSPGVLPTVAHDAIDTGDPLKIGGYAKTTAPTNVADGDRVNAWFSPNGALNVNVVAGGGGGGGGAVAGDVAHDAADSGNPIKLGGYAKATAPTNVADADRVNAWFLQNGALSIAPGGVMPAYGSGANGSTVLRVALATDSPGVMTSAAHDAVDAGDPLKIGGYAKSTAPTNVADGDRVNAWFGLNGALKVDIVSGGTGGGAMSGDVAHDAADSGSPVKFGGYASAAAPANVSADADRVNAWFLRNGAQAINITAAGALIAGDAANGLDVDVTRLPALAAGTNNIGDVDVLTLPALPAGTNNIGDVDVLTLPVAFNSGATNATTQRVILATDSPGVENGVAHDAVDSGNPNKLGGYAKAAAPTDVSADGDRVNAWFLRNGSQVANIAAGSTLITGDANGLDVDVTRIGGQTPAFGSGANGATVLRVALATDSPGVDSVAHDATDAGAPQKIGGYASTAIPTAVSADGDRVNAWFTRNGAQVSTLAGTAGALIPGDATYGMRVANTTTKRIQVTYTTDTAIYASGEVIADTQVMTGMARQNDGTGIITDMCLLDKADVGAAFFILILNANVALGTENAAPTITDANAANIIAVIPVATTDWLDVGGSKVCNLRGLNIAFQAVSGASTLYTAILNGTGTPTFAGGTDLVATFGVLQD